MLQRLPRITDARTARASSWDTTGRNCDRWTIAPGERRVLADITGRGRITHIWMTQQNHYRDCLLRITWDDAPSPSVLVPLGDFFCLGHGIVNSFQALPFTASTGANNRFERGCALNCYLPMCFRKRARVELINESDEPHVQYFYVDYELGDVPDDAAYLHAEFRRTNPFGGWGGEIRVNTPEADAANAEHLAWNNNYVILETRGRGHYIGCNLSVTNFQGTWWGEGDDMIWVDGYKWPPDLHGTGSEDYFNQAWGMQPNAFARNGSSIHQARTGGYQTSYVFHLENPLRFGERIKVTIEHGHANHLANEMSSVAYWYAEKPTGVATPPPAAKRQAVLRDNRGNWLYDKANQCPGTPVDATEEMRELKARWARKQQDGT
ncbi:MAG: glycoside hydrolase family 172 protein [Planctomycetota bacterium]